MTAQPGRPTDLAAIGLVLLSSLLFTLGYAMSKPLIGTYGLSAPQVTFLRCTLVLAVGGTLAAAGSPRVTWQRILFPARAWEQRAAAAALITSIVLAFIAYAVMPVTVASASMFTAPLLLTAFAGLVLKERISAARWLAAGIGFAGTLVIVQPGGAAFSAGLAASFASAAAYALYQILVRRLRTVATNVDSLLQSGLVGLFALGGAMAVYWRPMSLGALGLSIICTAVQTGALACITAALRRDEASRLAPWQYSGQLWAMLLDAVLFASPPGPASWVGGALILAGGVLAQGWPAWGRLGRKVQPG